MHWVRMLNSFLQRAKKLQFFIHSKLGAADNGDSEANRRRKSTRVVVVEAFMIVS